MARAPQHPFALLELDDLLDDEQKAMRDVVRSWVDAKVRPHVADWFEEGTIPARELAKELGQLGVLGMHLDGYGCAGTDATSYGLACLELEAGDSGLRSLVSVQGSLAMFPIHAYGTEEQKQQWLPGMAAGDLITEVNRTPVANSSQATREFQKVRSGQIATVLVVRDTQEVFLTLRKP